jgi:hypothetical protein
MRKFLSTAAVAVCVLIPARGWSQQNAPKPAPAESEVAAANAPALAPQQDSLAEAARKAREQKKDTTKSAKVFTNDNLPNQGGISSVGQGPEAPSSDSTAPGNGASSRKDEKAWRDRFAQLRHKLEQDQANRDVMQREFGVDRVQWYGDPMKQLQQGYTNEDINKKKADIDDMDKKIAADEQALSDAEEELRKSGGDSGWAR